MICIAWQFRSQPRAWRAAARNFLVTSKTANTGDYWYFFSNEKHLETNSDQ
jgi:hypothetical protein